MLFLFYNVFAFLSPIGESRADSAVFTGLGRKKDHTLIVRAVVAGVINNDLSS